MLSRGFSILFNVLMRWLPRGGRRALLELAQMPQGRRLVRGAVASLVMTAVSIVFGVASSVLLGRSLGPSGYGLYSLAMLLIGTVTGPIWYGMATLLTRETGRILAAGTRGDMGDLLRRSYGLALLIAALLTVAAVAVLLTFGPQLGAEQFATGMVALPLIVLSIMMPLNSTLLRGLGGLVRSQFCDLTLRPLLAIAVLLALWEGSGAGLRAGQGLFAQELAIVGASALSGFWLLRGWQELPVRSRRNAPPFVSGFLPRNLIAFCAFAAAGALYSSIDSLLLGALKGNSELGVYRVALIAVQLISGFIQAINTIVLPTIARLHAEGDRVRLQRLLTLTSRAMWLLSAAPVLVLVVFGGDVLAFGFGPAYAAGAPALAIVSAGLLVSGLAGPVGSVFNMTGRESVALAGILAAALVNALLCLLLIPPLGITGAAISATTGAVCLNAFLTRLEPGLTGVSSAVFPRRRPPAL